MNSLQTLKKKAKSKKGFTLMEMLIVVAIIAILIAIAIPSFSSALNKAKKSTDDANIRSAYAEHILHEALKNEPDAPGDATFTKDSKTIKFADTTEYILKYYTDITNAGTEKTWAGVK